jgi:DHA3 family macrolide efflux protein-like MFS transporter
MTVDESAGRARSWAGMGAFLRLWLGSTVSIFGTALSGFAIGVWVFERTGSATEFSLIAFFNLLPGLLLAPLIGPLVDRFDRRTILILGDVCAALVSLAFLALLSLGRLETWAIYLLVSITSISNMFQMIAFEASLSLLVPRQHFGRAHGMLHFGQAGAQILAPPLAAVLIGTIQVQGVVLIDFLTFLFGMSMLFTVSLPAPPASAQRGSGAGSLLRESWRGWTYIRERPGLVGLVGYLAVLNLLLRLGTILMTPLVLAFASATRLGFVVSAGGIGTLLGGLLMSIWGGPKRRVSGILALTPLMALGYLLTGLRASVPWIAAGVFLFSFAVPLINGSYLALWQTKVAAELQGRVFAMRRLIVQITSPLAYLIAGPLADHVFEPLLAAGGRLAPSLGPLLGTGKGRGIGLLFVTMALSFLFVTAASLIHPRLRRVESELPDVSHAGAQA